jgi:flagellar motor protein MotB
VERVLAILALAACSSASSRPLVVEPPPRMHPPAQVADNKTSPPLVPPAPVRVTVTTSDECGFILDSIYFPDGSATPATHQDPVIDEIATMFVCTRRKGEVLQVEVSGHADANERDPLGLSDARAHAIVGALVKRGVAADTLTEQGYGALDPRDPRKTDDARAKNRRVDFLIVSRRPAP